MNTIRSHLKLPCDLLPAPRGRRWAPRIAGLTVAIVLATATLAGCSPDHQARRNAATTPHDVTLTKAQRQSIHTLTIEPRNYRTTITTTGVVDFDHNRATQVLAPFSGAVTKLLVTLGDTVKQDQPLAQVHSSEFASAIGAYRKAVLSARAADAVAANDRELYAHQAISQRENAQAQAAAAGADADRDAALQALVALHMDAKTIAAIRDGKPVAHGLGVIRAPIAGRIVARSIAPGQTLTAGATPCFTIADTSRMWVMARLFGKEIGRVQTGDRARIETGDGDKPLAGTVTNVGAVIDPDTRSVTARIAVDNPDGVLKKAMYVEVRIRSRSPRTGIFVPVSAVLRNGADLPFVYVVNKNGGYARRRVTLGPRLGRRFVIASGLAAGEKVVTNGGIFLNFIQSQ